MSAKRENKDKLMCCKCGVELESEETSFSYIGHTFHTEILRCPKCGEAYIDEALARGRMAEVEQELEDK